MTRATGSHAPRPSTPEPDTAPVRGAMPGWAARHLAEAAESAEVPPPAPGRHRYGRRLHPEPHRLRGWALATAAVAAAVGTVPLAVSTLMRPDEALPQVQAFPVVAPVDVGQGGATRAAGGTADAGEPGTDAAGTLPPLTDPAAPEVVSPRVAPTAANRPWHAEAPQAPQAEQARIPRARPPRTPQRPPSTSVTPTTDPAPGGEQDGQDGRGGEDPRDGSGGTTTTSPREATPTTTTSPSPADDDTTPSRRPGLLGSTVHQVSGLLG